MVEKKSSKLVFLQTLLVSLLLFSFGMLIGALVENSRANQVNDLYLESQLGLTDLRIETDIISNIPFDCETAVKENINFADKIYSEARTLEKYDESGKISDELKLAHKRYDVLRTLLWYNSIKIKEKCQSFHTVVYFYKYVEPAIAQKSEQNVFSKLLFDLKQKKQNEIILIPIAADMDINSLNLLMKTYNVTQLPTILIDEKAKVTEIITLEELEKHIT